MLGADTVAAWGKVHRCLNALLRCFGRWRPSLTRWGEGGIGCDCEAFFFPLVWLACMLRYARERASHASLRTHVIRIGKAFLLAK